MFKKLKKYPWEVAVLVALAILLNTHFVADMVRSSFNLLP
jgi:hypothetical protein